MKTKVLITLAFFSLVSLFFLFEKNKTQLSDTSEVTKHLHPQPTEIGGPESKEEKVREEAESQAKREAWFEMMHRAAPDVNWKSIEAKTRYDRHIKRAAFKTSATFRGGDEEILANGLLKGSWCERGSKNQAGRVLATEYDPVTDEIWLVSAGGTLYKGPRDGSDWTVINQDLRFNGTILKFIPTDTGRRLFLYLNGLPHYSDDDGITWLPSIGIINDSNSGNFHKPTVLTDSLNRIYVLAKKSYWDDIELFKSEDKGTSFTKIKTFGTNDFRTFTLNSPHHTDSIYLLERTTSDEVTIMQINKTTDELDTLSVSPISLGNSRANLIGTKTDSSTLFYIYDKDKYVHASHDFGQTWETKDTLLETPWSVGMYVTPSDPEFLFMGEVECFISGDASESWFKLNNWWDYYDNVLHKIHADMMHFNEFQTASGENFMLVSNDGGLSISTEYGNLVNGYTNIALEGLNVSQYYDVVSDPNPGHAFIYAGAQDQGMQRAFTLTAGDDEALEFDQLISGDYGHITFSKNNTKMWIVYPGGWVSYYFNPQSDNGPSFSYEVDSEDESVWIPPLMASPDPSEDVVYLAGGSTEVDGYGSFIIKLEQQNNEITATNLPYDFKLASDGTVSALTFSPLDPNKWFVATNNGKFYRSNDQGQSWSQASGSVPNAQYLYGNTIIASSQDADVIYVGGSGYSNAPVLKSTNGGISFTDLSDGLPETLVYELAANADESMLFAATEAGPYVYVASEEQWYDMAGIGAPAQTYWSVEYLEEFNLVRFGTYGRGIWDFRINEEVDVDNVLAENAINVFPNPTQGIINIEMNDLEGSSVNALLFDISGKLILEKTISLQSQNFTKEQLDLSSLNAGIYMLKIENEKGSSVERIVVEDL